MEQTLAALKSFYNTHHNALCDAGIDGYLSDAINDLEYEIEKAAGDDSKDPYIEQHKLSGKQLGVMS